MAAYPWSTADANATRSPQFTGERCAEAGNGCHWVKAALLALARLGSAVSMEMMLVEIWVVERLLSLSQRLLGCLAGPLPKFAWREAIDLAL